MQVEVTTVTYRGKMMEVKEEATQTEVVHRSRKTAVCRQTFLKASSSLK